MRSLNLIFFILGNDKGINEERGDKRQREG